MLDSNVTGADGYFVYASYCGQPLKKIKTIKNVKTVSYKITKLDGKVLNLKKNYKLCIVAYKTIDGKQTRVATVTSTGKITAKKAGKCTIYVYARNGYAKKITVTVK